MRKYSAQDVALAVDFALIYSYARSADQADDVDRIPFTRDFATDKETIAQHLGWNSYESLPDGTKSLLGSVAARIKKKKQLVASGHQPFEFALRDLIQDLTEGGHIHDT
jgi:hypothetical protein